MDSFETKRPAVSGGPWCHLVIAFDRAIYRTLHRPPHGGVVFIAVVRFREMAAAFMAAESRRVRRRVSSVRGRHRRTVGACVVVPFEGVGVFGAPASE